MASQHHHQAAAEAVLSLVSDAVAKSLAGCDFSVGATGEARLEMPGDHAALCLRLLRGMGRKAADDLMISAIEAADARLSAASGGEASACVRAATEVLSTAFCLASLTSEAFATATGSMGGMAWPNR